MAATHRNLRARVQGLSRENLYYQFNVLPVGVSPLHSRCGDLQMLAEHFLRLHAPDG